MTSRCPDTFTGRFFLKPLCPLGKRLFRRMFRLKVSGEENIPATGAYIVAPNHRSYIDPLVLNAVFPEPLFFLAKEELFRPPSNFPSKCSAGDVLYVFFRRGQGLNPESFSDQRRV